MQRSHQHYSLIVMYILLFYVYMSTVAAQDGTGIDFCSLDIDTVDRQTCTSSLLSNKNIFADIKNCAQYFHCRGNNIETKSCNRDMLFDAETFRCVPQDEATCLITCTPDPPMSTPCELLLPCEEGARQPNTALCDRYYECEKNDRTQQMEWKPKTCFSFGGPKHFNKTSLQCANGRANPDCVIDCDVSTTARPMPTTEQTTTTQTTTTAEELTTAQPTTTTQTTTTETTTTQPTTAETTTTQATTTTQPTTTKPTTTQPTTAETTTTQPTTTQPTTAETTTTQPTTAETTTTQPTTTKPTTTQPTTAETTTTQPTTTQPTTTQPTTAETTTTQPTTAETTTTQPTTTKPTTTQPTTAETTTTKPTTTQPTTAEPPTTQPTTTHPTTTQAVTTMKPTAPQTTIAVTTTVATTESVLTERASTEPTLPEQITTEPTLPEQITTEPTLPEQITTVTLPEQKTTVTLPEQKTTVTLTTEASTSKEYVSKPSTVADSESTTQPDQPNLLTTVIPNSRSTVTLDSTTAAIDSVTVTKAQDDQTREMRTSHMDITTPGYVQTTSKTLPLDPCNLPNPCVLGTIVANPATCTSYFRCDYLREQILETNWNEANCVSKHSRQYFDSVSNECVNETDTYVCAPPCSPSESTTTDGGKSTEVVVALTTPSPHPTSAAHTTITLASTDKIYVTETPLTALVTDASDGPTTLYPNVVTTQETVPATNAKDMTTVPNDMSTAAVPDIITTAVTDVMTTAVLDVITTAAPDVMTTAVPDVITTAAPDVVTTAAPDVITTAVPDVITTAEQDDITTAVPDVITTAIPDVITTAIPDVITTAVPDVITTAEPDVITTAVPDVMTSAIPDVITTAIPDVITTAESDVVTTAVPDDITSTIPDVITTAVPDVISTAGPDVITTAAPDVITTAEPDVITTAVPDVITTAVPDVITTAAPDVITTAIPDVITTAVPDVITTALPDVITTAVPDAKTPVVPDAITTEATDETPMFSTDPQSTISFMDVTSVSSVPFSVAPSFSDHSTVYSSPSVSVPITTPSPAPSPPSLSLSSVSSVVVSDIVTTSSPASSSAATADITTQADPISGSTWSSINTLPPVHPCARVEPCQEKAKIAHFDDCHKYYECVVSANSGAKWLIRACTGRLKFDETTRECVDESVATCFQEACAPIPGHKVTYDVNKSLESHPLGITCSWGTDESLGSYEITWFLNDRKLVQTTRMKATQLQSGSQSGERLDIDPLKATDAGFISCTVRFSAGQQSTVTEALDILPIPRVAMKPLTLTVMKGQSKTLTCRANVPQSDHPLATEPSSIVWYRNKQPISLKDSEVVLERDPYTSTLEFPALSASTEYGCTATNRAGTSEVLACAVNVMEEDEPYCDDDTENGMLWTMTAASFTALMPCPRNQTGLASRMCVFEEDDDSAEWGEPNFNQCISPEFYEMILMLDALEEGIGLSDETLEEVTELLQEITSEGTMSPGDLNAATSVVLNLGEIRQREKNMTMGQEEHQAMVSVISNMVSANNYDSWESISGDDPSVSTQVLHTVDMYGEVAARQLSEDVQIMIMSSNLLVQIESFSKDASKSVSFPDMPDNPMDWMTVKDNIAVEKETFDAIKNDIEGDRVSLFSAYFKDIQLILPEPAQNNTGNGSESFVNSRVLSLSILNLRPAAVFNPPVAIDFLLVEESQSENFTAQCAFWNFTLNDTEGGWDTRGCRHINSTDSSSIVSCECDHLTNFAILMSPDPAVGDHHYILSIISIVGCVISIGGMVLTILLYCVIWKHYTSSEDDDDNARHVKSHHAVVLINMCIALIIADVLFIAGADKVEHQIACLVVAVLLHYFYLVAFFMMLVEGIELLWYTIYVFHHRRKRETALLIIMAWFIPAIIVGISLGVTKMEGYGNENFCWLAVDTGLLWAFVGPVLLIILINMIIIVVVLRRVSTARVNGTVGKKKNKIKSSIRNLLVIMPVMGVAWIFGVFTVNQGVHSEVFQYIFVIANSLQGLFIFIFHALCNKKVLESLCNTIENTSSTVSSLFHRVLTTKKGKFSSTKTSSRTARSRLKSATSSKSKKTNSTSSGTPAVTPSASEGDKPMLFPDPMHRGSGTPPQYNKLYPPDANRNTTSSTGALPAPLLPQEDMRPSNSIGYTNPTFSTFEQPVPHGGGNTVSGSDVDFNLKMEDAVRSNPLFEDTNSSHSGGVAYRQPAKDYLHVEKNGKIRAPLTSTTSSNSTTSC